MYAQHCSPLAWALLNRITFNKLNTYCPNWNREHKYFLLSELLQFSDKGGEQHV